MEQVGIQKLKQDVTTVCKVIGTTDKALEDGKISLFEGVGIAKDAIGLIAVARGWKESKKEIEDLSPAEKQELTAHIEKEFDLRNDAAERMVETGLQLIISLGAAIVANKAA